MTPITRERIQVHLRWGIPRDIPDILDIEQQAFASPWSEQDHRRYRNGRNSIVQVVEDARERVCGFMLYNLDPRCIYLDRIAVHPAYQRSGVGSQMVAKLVGKLSPHRRKRIRAFVPETELAAQCFLRANGFLAREILHNETEDGRDVYVMVYHIREGQS